MDRQQQLTCFEGLSGARHELGTYSISPVIMVILPTLQIRQVGHREGKHMANVTQHGGGQARAGRAGKLGVSL